MKLADPATTFEGSLPAGTRLTFQLKSNPKMFAILSDGIYSDKIAAVIRELSCNAHDSNVMAKSPRKFTVNVPSQLDPNFWVEDTGLGIDPEKIVDIFWTYGASTKTDSNETIGALGLGSKSPFAYTKSSFLVVNRYNGVEYKYFCFINEVGIPDGKLIYEQQTTECNGVRVELAVRTSDIRTFREKIIKFFSFWDDASIPAFDGDDTVLSEINKLKARRTYSGSSWTMRSNEDVHTFGSGAYAVMGGVPYPINLRAIGSASSMLTLICSSMINVAFPMGTLDFQVSREELSYTDETIKALETVAATVTADITAHVKQQLAGHATPFELSKAYRKTLDDLKQVFPYIKKLLQLQVFALTDGRTFTSEQLLETDRTLKTTGLLKFNIQSLERRIAKYQKGTQFQALETEVKVSLERPEVIDPATNSKRRAAFATVLWFKPTTVGAPRNPVLNRKHTAANYLHEGYAPKESYFQQRSSTTVAFIINDLGEKGAEGIRFYKEGFKTELNDLYFIDGSPALTADETEQEFAAFVRNTILEGAPTVRLSALPNFKLPEAPPKSAAPRNPAQRGTVEQRMKLYNFETVIPRGSSDCEIGWYDNLELKFYAPNSVKTDYVRHQLDKPMLYVTASYGSPTTDFSKRSLEPQIIGALHTLGLLSDFTVQTPTGLQVRVGMLSDNNVIELKRRGVKLVSMQELTPLAEAKLKANAKLLSVFNQRFYSGYEKPQSTAAMIITSKLFLKHGMKHVAKTSKLSLIASAQERINELLADKQNCALVHLAVHWLQQEQLLSGKIDINQFVECYSMLNNMSSNVCFSSNVDTHVHLALYINMVDAMAERQQKQAHLKQCAELYAEALFEMSK